MKNKLIRFEIRLISLQRKIGSGFKFSKISLLISQNLFLGTKHLLLMGRR